MRIDPAIVNNVLWVRIFDVLGSGLAYSTMAIVLAGFLRFRDVGHRTLIMLTVIFFGLRAMSSFISAWDLYTGVEMIAVGLRTVTAIYGGFYALAFIAAKDDLLITLRTTEEQDLRRKDLLRDVEQIKLNLNYIGELNLTESRDLVLRQRMLLIEAAGVPG